ncbi:MAG: hypothetical protein LEGION0398_MBIBDBAK_00049 [Legionellaceae bacterium]
MSKNTSHQKYCDLIKTLSNRIVKAQRPLRILDSIKWHKSIQEDFFKHKFTKLPAINRYYYEKNPLPYNPQEKIDEFYTIERDIRHHLGQFSPIGNIMQRICQEYRKVVNLIMFRGQPEFSWLSQELYGSSEDAFFAGAPNLKDLAQMISSALNNLNIQTETAIDEKKYSSKETVELLQQRMDTYFQASSKPVKVILDDGIISDAAAGADTIKIRPDTFFSERDIRILEVHEGWVHIGTTLNGQAQPTCTFLSIGTPSTTVTQEGLAIIMEIFTFASFPGRVKRLTNRITAIHKAEKGANFLDIFNFFREQDLSNEESYANSVRIFRGSLPDAGPFTKDLSYSKGFVLIYNYLQIAIHQGLINRIPLLFCGKTVLEDLKVYEELIAEKVLIPPTFIPPQFKDLASLSAWMCYANFFNRLDLERVAGDFKIVL